MPNGDDLPCSLPPAIISGTAKMRYRQFAVWNFVASIAYALSVAATSYGVGRLATGHHTTEDVAILIFGLALSALIVAMFVRRHRRQKQGKIALDQ